MAVYVDDMEIPYKRMKMCHMAADTTAELEEMVDRLCLSKKDIEYKGLPKEHINISKSFRKKAIKLGTQAITRRELVKIIQKKRTILIARGTGKHTTLFMNTLIDNLLNQKV